MNRRPLLLSVLQAGQQSCQAASCRQKSQAWCRRPGRMLSMSHVINTPSAWHGAAAYIAREHVQSLPASQCCLCRLKRWAEGS